MSESVRAIAIAALTHFDVCASGRHVEIGFVDHAGKPGRLYLSQDGLRSLLPSLSAAWQETGARRPADAAFPCAYPLLDWGFARDDDGATVLRLTASNAAEVAFRLPAPVASALGQGLLNAGAAQPPRQARLARLGHWS
jgi:hypothetical protein